MKATLNGITIEGTPSEFSELLKNETKKAVARTLPTLPPTVNQKSLNARTREALAVQAIDNAGSTGVTPRRLARILFPEFSRLFPNYQRKTLKHFRTVNLPDILKQVRLTHDIVALPNGREVRLVLSRNVAGEA